MIANVQLYYTMYMCINIKQTCKHILYVCMLYYLLSLSIAISLSLYTYIYIYIMIIYVHLSMIIQHNYGHPHKPAFFQCLMAKVPVKSHKRPIKIPLKYLKVPFESPNSTAPTAALQPRRFHCGAHGR